MECLRDYIGISGCETPGSELLVNSLPGISLASIDGLTTVEQSNYISIWDAVQTRALKRYASDINRIFAKRYRLRSIKKQMDFCSLLADGSNTEVEYQGMYFDFRTYRDYLTHSNLAKLYLQSVRYYCPAASVGDVATIELIQVHSDTSLIQDVVYSTTNTSVAGWNVIQVETGFDIGNYLLSVRGLTEYAIMPVSNTWSVMAYECFNGDSFNTCPPLVKGATALTSGNNKVVTTGQDTYGVSGEFSIVCSFDSIVCNNKALFSNPLWYLCGIELMVERMYSDRLNKWTLNDEKSQSLTDYYNAQYMQQLESLMDGVRLDLNDDCLECNGAYKMVEMIP